MSRIEAPSDCPPAFHVVKLPTLNKGTSFSHEERELHNLRGLFPGGEPISLDLKVDVAMEQLRGKCSNIDKYTFLHTIQDSDETLYHAILFKHLIEANRSSTYILHKPDI